MAQSPEYPDLLWMPPRSYTPGRKAGQPTKITVHYTAGREGYGNVDIDGAHYCQTRTDGTSAHYFVDGDSITHCIRTTDESHTALAHGNDDGIHYELCGTSQTRAQWLDPVSRSTIKIAAKQMARDMRKYNIPLVRLVGTQVRDRSAKGICGHVDFTVGWPEDGGSHTDPGPQFPWDVLFDDIRDALNGDDMSAESEAQIAEIHLLLTKGLRAGPSQTSGGGIPIAWLPRMFYENGIDLDKITAEVDTVEETQGTLLTLVAAIQAGDPQALATALAAQLRPELLADLIGALERVRLDVGE